MHLSYLFLVLLAGMVAAATNNSQSTLMKHSHSLCLDPAEAHGQYVVSKDGLKLYSESVGCRSAPPVILVTGFACSHLAFERLWNDPELREKLYMVRYDPRGHGLTDKPLDAAAYESERYADDVKAIVDTYGLDMPFFCGWSYGASTAADIASYFPSPLPFSGYCSFAGLPYTSVITNTTSPVVGAALTGIFDTANVTNALQARVDFAGVLSVLKKDVPYVDLSSWIGAASSMSPEVATLIQTRTQDATSLLEEGRKGWPLALFFGEQDDSVILPAVQEVLRPFKQQETHVFPNAGHISFYDNERAVAQKLLDFVYRFYGKSY